MRHFHFAKDSGLLHPDTEVFTHFRNGILILDQTNLYFMEKPASIKWPTLCLFCCMWIGCRRLLQGTFGGAGRSSSCVYTVLSFSCIECYFFFSVAFESVFGFRRWGIRQRETGNDCNSFCEPAVEKHRCHSDWCGWPHIQVRPLSVHVGNHPDPRFLRIVSVLPISAVLA